MNSNNFGTAQVIIVDRISTHDLHGRIVLSSPQTESHFHRYAFGIRYSRLIENYYGKEYQKKRRRLVFFP